MMNSKDKKFMSEQKIVAQKMNQVLPTPPEASARASAQSLKERLQWGEPSLTIIDARDRNAYLEERITGSMFIDDVSNLTKDREIYIYSNTDKKAAAAAEKLRQEGFESVSQLLGGLAGWKVNQGATEGREASAK